MSNANSPKQLPFLHKMSRDSRDMSISQSRKDLSRVRQIRDDSPSEMASTDILSKTLGLTQGNKSNLFDILKKKQTAKLDQFRDITFLKDRMAGSRTKLTRIQTSVVDSPQLPQEKAQSPRDGSAGQLHGLSRLPATIEVARVTLDQTGYARHGSKLLEKVDFLRKPLEERIARRNAQIKQARGVRSEKPAPRVVPAAKPEPPVASLVQSSILERQRQKVSFTRLEMEHLSAWVRQQVEPLIREFPNKVGGSLKLECVHKMKDAVDFALDVLQAVLPYVGTLSSTVRDLFRELRVWQHQTNKLGDCLVEEFLETMEDIHMEHIMEYNEAKDLEIEDLKIEIRGLDFRLKNKGYELDDRAEVIRKLKNKLTTYNYGLRFTKMELKHVEELNQIITKENDIITGIIHDTLHSVDQQTSTTNEQLEFVKDKLNQVYGIWNYYEDLRKQAIDKKNREEVDRTENPKVSTAGATHQ